MPQGLLAVKLRINCSRLIVSQSTRNKPWKPYCLQETTNAQHYLGDYLGIWVIPYQITQVVVYVGGESARVSKFL